MIAALTRARCVFLDRDGTLVHPRAYPRQPRDLRLYSRIGAQLRNLQQAGFRIVVLTNQSGVARGFFTEAELGRMHASLAEKLRKHDVELNAIYHCPHHPDGVVPEFTLRCGCRKPWPGLVLRAARDLNIALEDSWLVGDTLADVEAGNRAGCRTILVDLGTEPAPNRCQRQPEFVARSSRHALGIIRAIERLGPTADLTYWPRRWHSSNQTLPGCYGSIRQ